MPEFSFRGEIHHHTTQATLRWISVYQKMVGMRAIPNGSNDTEDADGGCGTLASVRKSLNAMGSFRVSGGSTNGPKSRIFRGY